MSEVSASRHEEAVPPDPGERRIGALARPVPPISPELSCSETYEIFVRHPGLRGLAVQEDGRPLGMASRETLMVNITNPVLHALYERRPIRLLMNRSPVVVEAGMTIDEVFERVAEGQGAALGEGFIVTREGRYLGIGSSLDLLRASVINQRQRIVELELARRAAEQASEAKSSFLANLSHELRTPLNAVIGFAELLQSAAAGPLNDKQRDYLSDIHVSGHLLLRLINDLLDLSRAEAGRLDLYEEEVELGGLVEAAARTLSPRARAQGLQLALDLPDGDLVVRADERKLLQILLNLGTNAVKFTQAGGRVVLRTALAGGEGGPGVFLEVEDSGIGIAEEQLPRVLETFGRADDPLTRQTEGAGIGLSLCRAFTELHGGRLELSSRPGVGTRVRALLPAHRLVAAPGTCLERA